MTASGRAGLAALLAVGMVLCTISRSVKIAGHPATVPACVSEADQAALKDSLVGRQVSRLLPDAPPTTGAAGTAGDQPPPQNSRGVAYRPKGTLFRTARAPCCPVKERGRRRDLSPRGARAGPSWWHARRASRLEGWAPPPLLHGAVWRTRGAEEGAFGTVGYASTILRYVRDWSPSDPPRPAASTRLNPHISQDSRGVAYRPKGTLFRTARAPCCPVEDRGRRPDLEP